MTIDIDGIKIECDHEDAMELAHDIDALLHEPDGTEWMDFECGNVMR